MVRPSKYTVLCCVLVSTMMSFGIIQSFGVLFLFMMDSFKESRATVVTVQALLVGAQNCFGVVSGVLIRRFGLRPVALFGSLMFPLGFILAFFAKSVTFLYVTVSCIAGMGISIVFVSGAAALVNYFDGPAKDMVIALQTACIGITYFIFPFLLRWLLKVYGINGTFLIMGGLFLNTIPVAWIFSSRGSKTHSTTPNTNHIPQDEDVDDGAKEVHETIPDTRTEIVIEKRELNGTAAANQFNWISFASLIIASALTVALVNNFNALYLDIVVWKGFTEAAGVLGYIPYSVANISARLLSGLVKQRQCIDDIWLLILSCLFGGIGLVLILFINLYASVLVGYTLMGITHGTVVATGSILAINWSFNVRSSLGLGILMTSIGVLSIAGGPSLGALRDVTGSYTYVMIIVASGFLFGAVLFSFLLYFRKHTIVIPSSPGNYEETVLVVEVPSDEKKQAI